MKTIKKSICLLLPLIIAGYSSVNAAMDIDIGIKDIKISPSPVAIGDNAQITVVIENKSAGDIINHPGFQYEKNFESFSVDLVALPDAVPTFSRGEELYYIFNGRFKGVGRKQIRFTVNAYGLEDVNAANNRMQKEIFVNPSFGFKADMGQQADVLVITKNKLAEKIGSYYYIGSACPVGYRLLSVRCDDDHFYSDRTDIAYAGSGSFEVDGKIAGYCRYHALTDPQLVIWNTCARFDAYPEIIKDERFMEKTEIGTLALVGGEELLTLEAIGRDYTPVDIDCRADEGVVLGSRQNSENGAFCYFAPNQKEKTMSVRYIDFLPELQTKRDETAACDQDVCPKSDQELGYLESAMEMEEQSLLLMSGNMDKILAGIGSMPDASIEQLRRSEHLARIDPDSRLAEDAKNALIKFISYGVDTNTKLLGAGERAAVVYSYYNAFGKMPETKSEITDLIKIANGRWPNLRSATAEKKALEDFIRVYQRLPNMEVSYDSSAMIVMSYGLRQTAKNRNLASERRAAGTFIEIFGHGPGSTEDWNILQAITYSGATRQLDTDRDLIADSWETRLGTDPKDKDTDNDGIGDGDELKNGTNPFS